MTPNPLSWGLGRGLRGTGKKQGAKNRLPQASPPAGEPVSGPKTGPRCTRFIYRYILESSRALRARLILGWTTTLDLTPLAFLCWQASCSDAHAILNEAHVQKHSDIDVSISTCIDHKNGERKTAQSAYMSVERFALWTQNKSFQQNIEPVIRDRLRESYHVLLTHNMRTVSKPHVP